MNKQNSKMFTSKENSSTDIGIVDVYLTKPVNKVIRNYFFLNNNQ